LPNPLIRRENFSTNIDRSELIIPSESYVQRIPEGL
jgi:hypothetical protein